MSKRRRGGSVMDKITDADMDRFHELAEVTLKRSNRAWFRDEFGRALSWLLFGLLPVIGLIWFNWSAREWLLFLLIAAWLGLICDVFKLYFLLPQIVKSADAAAENNFVWTIVDALREGKDVAPRDHLRSKYQPKVGIVIDLIFGGVGTFMIVGLFPGDLLAGLTEDRSLRVTLIGYIAYRVAFTCWEILEQRHPQTEDRPVRVAVGLRGAGLFVLGFLVAMFAGDDIQPNFSGGTVAWWVMLVVNGSLVLVALLTMWGISMLKSNARWPGKYLDGRHTSRQYEHEAQASGS